MRVLINCERSGIGREAFRARGHDAWSCDLEPADDGSPLQAMRLGWDFMIAHPPCTELAVCGARWRTGDQMPVIRAASFAIALYNAPIEKVVIEQPRSQLSSYLRKRDQEIQPWEHGHGETKATWLWLRNVPLLVSSNIVAGREPRIWKMAPGPDRARARSESYPGILKAMAEQWG